MREADDGASGSVIEVFRTALLLGLTAFGGPIAHLGYFHREYVERRRWVDDATYLDLVALTQLLPGPASSQVGMAIGLMRAGWPGAIASWLGFTLPSAALLTGFALVTADVDLADAAWVHGLKLAAVAIVASAVVSMRRRLAPDWQRSALAIAAAVVVIAVSAALTQVAVIGAGGLIGWRLLPAVAAADRDARRTPVGRRIGLVLLTAFAVVLVGLPLAAALTGLTAVAVVDGFYRAGALVFGGGHVVLPLLSESIVAPGWVTEDRFLAGYGAAQAAPGPLFTFAAYLGATLQPEPHGIGGALVALVAIFAPSFLLVGGVLPFWDGLRRSPAFRSALSGTNAAVIGLLLAALYDPVITSSILGPLDVVLALAAIVALVAWRAPPWAVVAALAIAAEAAGRAGFG